MLPSDLDDFFHHYLICALWSSIADPEGTPMDDEHDSDDIPEQVQSSMKAECLDFIMGNLGDLADITPEQAGHDFWLTRNGHGAGFWDRGLGAVGRRLTDACKPYGGCDLYIGDDGKVYASGHESKSPA